METPGQLLWLHVEVGVQGCPPSDALAEILTWGQGRGGDPLSGLGLSEEILTTRLFPEAPIPSRPLLYEEILVFFHNLCS